jgi:hypothetical protein
MTYSKTDDELFTIQTICAAARTKEYDFTDQTNWAKANFPPYNKYLEELFKHVTQNTTLAIIVQSAKGIVVYNNVKNVFT